MKLKQKIRNIIFVIAIVSGALVAIAPLTVSADTNTSPPPDTCENTGNIGDCNSKCGVKTAIIDCKNVDDSTRPDGVTKNGVWSLLLTAINILTAGVGIAAVGGFVYAAILYTTAAGNADQVKKSMEFMRNIVIGLVVYAVMFALLNFIIPGGLF